MEPLSPEEAAHGDHNEHAAMPATGSAVKAALRERGFTHREAAERAFVTRETLTRVANGHRPSRNTYWHTRGGTLST
jgi:hypothetical protein